MWRAPSSLAFPPTKVVMDSRFIYKGNSMAAFMEESNAEVRIRYSHKEESSRLHSKTITFPEDPFPPPQFSNQYIPNPPTQQYCLPCDCNVYSAETVTEKVIKKGGNARRPRPVIFRQTH